MNYKTLKHILIGLMILCLAYSSFNIIWMFYRATTATGVGETIAYTVAVVLGAYVILDGAILLSDILSGKRLYKHGK